MKRLAIAVCVLAIAALPQQAPRDQAAELRALRQKAGDGDVKAQSELGFMYEFGAATAKQDYAKAIVWYRKAAEHGDVTARQGIARMYFEGKSVPKDYTEAARWLQCPNPSIQALDNCREITNKDLPPEARRLLEQMNCHVSSNYGLAGTRRTGLVEPLLSERSVPRGAI